MKTKYLLLEPVALGGLLTAINPAFAQHWIQTSAPITNWASVASSANGSKLVAAAKDGPIYTSTDSGANWMAASAPSTNWSAVASSADGRKLVATAGGPLGFAFPASPGPIYVSADSGATWTATSAPNTNWSAVASSADGAKLVAVAGGHRGLCFHWVSRPDFHLNGFGCHLDTDQRDQRGLHWGGFISRWKQTGGGVLFGPILFLAGFGSRVGRGRADVCVPGVQRLVSRWNPVGGGHFRSIPSTRDRRLL